MEARSREEPGSLAEEIANSVTHGVGLGLSLAGFAVLMSLAARYGGTAHRVSCGIYGGTLVTLYAASTLYHSFYVPRLKEILRIVDHSAIYLLIAGTYTPFALVNLASSGGWMLLGVVWTAALAGVVYKIFFIGRYPRFSTLAYLGMGWLIFAGMRPMMGGIPPEALAWLLAGGVLYTTGVWFYARGRVRYSHAIWHLFVLGGSACHYIAVLYSIFPTGP